jgi:lipid-binding SYLF domain-containing protein
MLMSIAWSAPSAIMTGGMGFGGQVGAELTDFIMVLNNHAAVKTFMDHGSITLGGNISGKHKVIFLYVAHLSICLVAAGPVGRNAEASGTASYRNVAAVYSYSKTRGLFAGVSLEGSVIIERFDANKKMYGHKVKARDLLNGTIPPPASAEPLYGALTTKFNPSPDARFGFMDRDSPRYSNQYSSGYSSPYPSGYSSPYSSGYIEPYNSGYSEPYSSRDVIQSDSPINRSLSRGAVHQMAKTGHHPSAPTMSSLRDLVPVSDSSRDLVPVTNNNSSEPRVRALFNFNGEQEGDLAFHKGDIISIVKKSNTKNDWWTGRLNGRQGIFPANFVEEIF